MKEDELKEIKKRLLEGMREFQKECDGAYHIWDVWKVDCILKRYYRKMYKCHKSGKGEFMDIVKEAVIAFNELNEKCDCSLIETEQREDICIYMMKTAYSFNFIQDENEDITGEWRDW